MKDLEDGVAEKQKRVLLGEDGELLVDAPRPARRFALLNGLIVVVGVMVLGVLIIALSLTTFYVAEQVNQYGSRVH